MEVNAHFRFSDVKWIELRSDVIRAKGDVSLFDSGRPWLEDLIEKWIQDGRDFSEECARLAKQNIAVARHATRAIDDLTLALNELGDWSAPAFLHILPDEVQRAASADRALRDALAIVREHLLARSENDFAHHLTKRNGFKARNSLWVLIGAAFWMWHLNLKLGTGNPSPACDFIFHASESILEELNARGIPFDMSLSKEAVRTFIRTSLVPRYAYLKFPDKSKKARSR